MNEHLTSQQVMDWQSGVSDAELDAKSALRVCHFLACLFADSRASQINSSQIN